jgi:hypothetical protein
MGAPDGSRAGIFDRPAQKALHPYGDYVRQGRWVETIYSSLR